MYLHDTEIKRLFGNHIYERGLNYYRLGRVELHEVEDDFLEAEVAGSDLYYVTVRQRKNGLSFYCSCPYDELCKHQVAALLAARDGDFEYDPDGQTELFHPKVATPAWQAYFDNFARSGADSQTVEQHWRLSYLLALEKHGWWLKAHKQKMKQGGEWGKGQAVNGNDFAKLQMINDGDRLVLSFLEKWRMAAGNYYHWSFYPPNKSKYEFNYGAAAGALFKELRHGIVYMEQEHETVRLSVWEQRAELFFSLNRLEQGFGFSPYLALGNEEIKLSGNFTLLTTEPVWLLFDGQLLEISGKLETGSLLPFMDSGYQVNIEREELSQFLESLSGMPELFKTFRFPEGFEEKTTSEITEKRLYLSEFEDGICVQLRFAYGPVIVDIDDPKSIVLGMDDANATFVRATRDQAAESEALGKLMQTSLKKAGGGIIQTYKNKSLQWMFDDVPGLLKDGFVIYGEENLKKFKVNRSQAQVRVQVESGIDWFDLLVEIDVGGVLMSLQELKKAVRKKSRFVKLADGSVAALPTRWLNKFKHAFNLGEDQKNNLRLSHLHVTLIDELFDETLEQTDAAFREKLQRLRNFDGIQSHEVPDTLEGNLRPYQQDGFNWLHFLKTYQFGGCLADDMGLGKTIQALTMLLHQARNGQTLPNLIVTPTSVVFNWLDEIERFAPSLRVLNQTGAARERVDVTYSDYDIVLTSYGTLRRDILFLKDVEFEYVILDESQNIKNPLSQTAKAIKLLQANNRLALTGTPVENNTIELWSLFSFLNPGLLGNLSYFKEAFAKPIEKDGDEETAKLLRKTIFPFILRRTKEKVAKELPPKTENVLYAEMSPQHEKVYNQWRDYYRAALLKQIQDVGLNKSRMNVLEGLVKLRQLACHPLLVETVSPGPIMKYNMLLEHVDEICSEGHKVLVFSQFVKMLTIIRNYFDSARIQYAYLDGQTRDRKRCVQDFENHEDCRIFLISLKAGGTGLNLTSADYVIHYDPWWNPAVEAQATDRSHRIGQDKHVFVYKMITKATVEEKILELQKRKKDLVSNLITTEAGLFKKLTVEDIQELFS